MASGLLPVALPYEIHRIVDLVSAIGPPGVLLKDVEARDFVATRTARDSRFTDTRTGEPILSFHSYLVRAPGGTLLVDTCVGNDKDRPLIPLWHRRQGSYLDRLQAAGVHPEQIDFVCCTHLHADHAGWNTQLRDGRWVPTFPRARYLFAAAEVAWWQEFHRRNPADPNRNGWQDSVLPVLESGQAELVASDHEIMSGIRLIPAPGHTPGNVMIRLPMPGSGSS